ncbi:unnamed protein product [Heligmosomoides polygyrus]|uniref:DUF5641 domain-containing protein n=1 Tax=Heligmosomoides polygyrus TaxID=6339 RepID=A0A3P7ZHT1_HELPZ|nr:unnamed protein product [Heligmosomoides polygyrus]
MERITKRTNHDLRDKLLRRIPKLRFHYEDDFITVPEAERTSKLLLRNHQQVHVEGKINPQKNSLIPSKDLEGIIRCRGRLQQSHLPDKSKFPILVGAQSDLASLIIKVAHATFHLLTAHIMTRVREKCWIPQLRRQVQKILRRCVPCQRMNTLPYRYPEMSDLPARRVTPSRPLLHVGIDYFGPITKIWSEQYLTSLREQQVRFLPGNHGSPRQPEPGQVVLLADPNLPRNTWKMGRVTNVTANSEGIVREVELVMPNRRVTKRAINQLIPLELEAGKNN